MTFAEELDQLIAMRLGPKATFGDYMAAAEALEKARFKLDEHAETQFSEAEATAWEEANIRAGRASR